MVYRVDKPVVEEPECIAGLKATPGIGHIYYEAFVKHSRWIDAYAFVLPDDAESDLVAYKTAEAFLEIWRELSKEKTEKE